MSNHCAQCEDQILDWEHPSCERCRIEDARRIRKLSALAAGRLEDIRVLLDAVKVVRDALGDGGCRDILDEALSSLEGDS